MIIDNPFNTAFFFFPFHAKNESPMTFIDVVDSDSICPLLISPARRHDTFNNSVRKKKNINPPFS